jgi:hypothetical protein
LFLHKLKNSHLTNHNFDHSQVLALSALVAAVSAGVVAPIGYAAAPAYGYAAPLARAAYAAPAYGYAAAPALVKAVAPAEYDAHPQYR